VIALHDEIDLPFGEVRSKLGGGVAGHNGLRSLSEGLGSKDFWRVRGGVGRPNTTDPEIVSSYVLSRFREPDEEVGLLIHAAADEVERLLEKVTSPETEATEDED
jgi:PTH1 family peptidyl-tRNA hydrolase